MNSNPLSALYKFLRVLLLCICFMPTAHALEPFQIQDIRIEGLQRTEPGTVLATIPFRVGENYSDEKGTLAIRNLFALGLFKDVRIEVNASVVVVIVEERPIIGAVDFVGIKEFDKDTLRKALKDIGLSEGRPYDKALTDRAEQELKRQYINKSLYGADVVTTVTPSDRNRINLNFTVVEGDVARIKSLRIVGAKAFDESTLKDQMDLSEPNYMSWYTKADRYSQAKLNADLESIKSYYLSRGYLEFRVDSTQVAISANKQDISITINITEGNSFVVSRIMLEGYYLGRDSEFKSLISIKPGQPYNLADVVQTTKAFSDYFGNFGFAFARIEPRTEIDRTTNQVQVVLQADPSRRAYVRRINISGNDRTKDDIIRREFRQMESSWYDGERIRTSRDRVDRLGYFTEVTIDTQEVPGSQLFLSFGISQDNFFGTGNSLGINVNTSKYNRVLNISTTDPYFTEDGVSRSLYVSHRSSKPYLTSNGDYSIATSAFGVSFGIPFAEIDTVFVSAALEQTKINTGTNIPKSYTSYINEFGTTSQSIPLGIGWARDSRDSLLAPSKGRLVKLNGEVGVGDTRYYRNNVQFQEFFPIGKKYTFAVNAELGYGEGLSGKNYPVFKNYYAGGLGSVRGFQQGSLGPKDYGCTNSSWCPVGGSKKVVLNTEFYVPFPGVGNDRTLRLYSFLDAGNVFDSSIELEELRTSFGVGLSWISPVGPLRFAVAKPIRKFDGDRMQSFQFQIGTSF
ncbi:MAG: outer membrane protein assembly factor BamA [Betaproteobacteria bacterium]|nr:outer membrane protein assembly factor BamA [Betaproteobacteria bacterium]